MQPISSVLLSAVLLLAAGMQAAAIPDDAGEITRLGVAVLYNDEAVQIRYRFETDSPSWYHQVWRYTDGEWVRHGSGGPGPDPHGLYEDRISMLLDDGTVEDFSRFGGFMTAHEGMRTLDSAADTEAVTDHPLLGETMGRSDVRKYLPDTRRGDRSEAAWDKTRSEEELAEMRERGEFLDLWQWRAHRSHPVGKADNGLVLHYRLSADGRGMYTTNWDDDTGQPAWMFDPDQTGFHALEWERLIEQGYSQDDPYYLSEDNAVPFDASQDWQEGDVIPQRFLREPSGSRGAIDASGNYRDGAWRIALTRSLEAPDALDSKMLKPGGRYSVAFAVHAGGYGARWHRVSLPLTLYLDDGSENTAEGNKPELVARRVEGDLDAAEVSYTDVPVFYPGQVTWQWLHGQDHPGQPLIETTPIGIRDVAELHPLDELIEWIQALERDGELPEEVQR